LKAKTALSAESIITPEFLLSELPAIGAQAARILAKHARLFRDSDPLFT
jgi:hypothetical protein